MAWHHRPGDRVRLVYRLPWSPWKGATGTVRVRGRPRRGTPLNFLADLDGGGMVIVPGGNLRAEKGG